MENKKEMLKEFEALIPKGYASLTMPLYEVQFEHSYNGIKKFKEVGKEFKKELERLERIFELGRLLRNEGLEVFEFHARRENPVYYEFVGGKPLEISSFYIGPGVIISNPSYITEYVDVEGETWIKFNDSFLEDPIGNIIKDIAKLKKDLQKFESFVNEWS